MGPSLAEMMFNAYNEQGLNPWKTFDGRDVPRWDAINDQVRAKWEAAAKCAADVLCPSPSTPPPSEDAISQGPMKVAGVSAKFQVKSVNNVYWGPGSKPHIVFMEPVTSGPGNEAWSQYTPAGKLEMTITNPDAAGFFAPGKNVYLNFTEAP